MRLDKHSMRRVAFWAFAAVLALDATIQNGYAQGGGPPGGAIHALAIDPSNPATPLNDTLFADGVALKPVP